jgi:hypothetical protein
MENKIIKLQNQINQLTELIIALYLVQDEFTKSKIEKQYPIFKIIKESLK